MQGGFRLKEVMKGAPRAVGMGQAVQLGASPRERWVTSTCYVTAPRPSPAPTSASSLGALCFLPEHVRYLPSALSTRPWPHSARLLPRGSYSPSVGFPLGSGSTGTFSEAPLAPALSWGR